MKVWILRHGEAQPHARRDAERERRSTVEQAQLPC